MAKGDKCRFIALRSRIFKLISAQLAEDPCCKSYEGTLEITAQYPNYFEDNEAECDADYYCITLHCYVLGGARHYDFIGKTLCAALDKLEETVNEWECYQ